MVRPRNLLLRLLVPLAVVLGAALVLDAAEGRASDLIAGMRKKIREKPKSISGVLRTYNTIEKQKKLNDRERHRLHEGLLEELMQVEDVAIVRAATSFLKRTGASYFPAQVLLVKAAISPRFPAERTETVSLLATTARRTRHARLMVWTVRMLAESRWPEAIDALIDLLEEEEKGGRFFEPLYHAVKAELYRVMGGDVAQVGSQKIRKIWEASGKRLSEDPDYVAGTDKRTVAFFGDRVVPGSVFCIDASGSMADETRLRSSGARDRTAVAGGDVPGVGKIDTTPRESKLDIVKRELSSALKGLHPSWEFQVAGYSDAPKFWKAGKRGSRVALVKAREKSVRRAIDFTQDLAADGATNIHDTLAAALLIPEIDTVYLLSDGEPTRGGGMRAIESGVAALNYLQGVRIITYGFRAEKRFQLRPRRGRRPSRHEEFMRRLALLNWGWYRRLN